MPVLEAMMDLETDVAFLILIMADDLLWGLLENNDYTCQFPGNDRPRRRQLIRNFAQERKSSSRSSLKAKEIRSDDDDTHLVHFFHGSSLAKMRASLG